MVSQNTQFKREFPCKIDPKCKYNIYTIAKCLRKYDNQRKIDLQIKFEQMHCHSISILIELQLHLFMLLFILEEHLFFDRHIFILFMVLICT